MKIRKYFKINHPETKNHYHGLDTIRAFSVLIGMLWHFMQVPLANKQLSFILSTGPWGGANPLFVVSGFLLGNQILSRHEKNIKVSLIKFYFRRALKTWPSYLILITIIFFNPFFDYTEQLPSYWRFLTFTQNFNLSENILSHTWSLCIEEHFYLLLPVISLLFINRPKLKNVAFVVLAIILSGLLLRFYLWKVFISLDDLNKFQIYFNKIYYQSYCRVDGLVFGVFLAYIQNYTKDIWKKLTEKGNDLALIGLLLCAIGFLLQIQRTNLISILFVFPIIALGFSFFLLGAIHPESFLNKTKIPGANKIATLSYCLYLVHKPINVWIEHLLFPYQLNTGTALIWAILLGYSICFVFAYLLYVFVEKPFLSLRDKYIPTIEN